MKLEIKNLIKKYNDVRALDGFSVTMTQGVYGLLGPNGAGKSTLMNILTDNLKRDDGEILYDGREILEMGADYRKIVGYMPQEQVGYSQFSAYEFLRYMAVLKGLDIKKTETKEQIDTLLKSVHLYDDRKRKAGGFSGGMKQRILIAQALINDPDILILDEPTAGLDPNERIRIRNLIAQISINKIVIIATHIVSDIEFIANKIIMLSAGKIIKNGSPSELLSEIDGYVFEEMIEKCNVEMYNQKYLVSGLMAGAQQVKIRYICNEKACNGHKVEPNLEDYYLYNTIK